MPKDDSLVKSFRTTEAQFNEANEIFKKEGFSYSEVIRLLLDATIREGRIPRGLSTKSVEEISDKSAHREAYVDSILNMVLPNPRHEGLTAEEKLLRQIFGEPEESKNMSNASLRDWGNKWGLPEELSIATLADLHDSELFSDDPWFGDYKYENDPSIGSEDLLTVMMFRENIRSNLEKVKNSLEARAVKILMEYNIKDDEIEDSDNSISEEEDE